MNWMKFHHNHCPKLAKNTFETIPIGDSTIAGLTRNQNVWGKFLKPLKALNCGVGGDKIQHGVHLTFLFFLKSEKCCCFM